MASHSPAASCYDDDNRYTCSASKGKILPIRTGVYKPSYKSKMADRAEITLRSFI